LVSRDFRFWCTSADCDICPRDYGMRLFHWN
jgi:hypothetical protein